MSRDRCLSGGVVHKFGIIRRSSITYIYIYRYIRGCGRYKVRVYLQDTPYMYDVMSFV